MINVCFALRKQTFSNSVLAIDLSYLTMTGVLQYK